MTPSGRIEYGELDVDAKQRTVVGGEPFTGTAIERSDHGAIEVEFVNGVRAGVSREWDASGTLRSEASYWNGALHGYSTEFDSAGRPTLIEVYEFGIVVARQRWIGGRAVGATWKIGPDDDLWSVLQLSRARYRAAPGSET